MPTFHDLLDPGEVLAFLKFSFEWGVRAQYKRFNLKVKSNSSYFAKAEAVEFELTNTDYLNALANDANYLINRSSMDATTRQQIIDLINEGSVEGLTMDEIA